MVSVPDGSQAVVDDARGGYEPPVVLATFQKHDLAEDLPENLTPHIHAVQQS
uniref:hypothetical protein n=1 Tax=Pseudonocardia sp. CA-138482 TaxID=3240023 RepID=UPI003F49774B